MEEQVSEDLKKQAQEKLSQARALIHEAGELAKQGQFHLHFGEIGEFIPKSMMKKDGYRAEALKIAMKEGLTTKEACYNWNEYDKEKGEFTLISPREFLPWDQLEEDQREELVDDLTEQLWSDSPVPYEFREYCDESDADRWWHPSRC